MLSIPQFLTEPSRRATSASVAAAVIASGCDQRSISSAVGAKSLCYHACVNDLYEQVDTALDEIRPYIHSHAGDVNIVDVTPEGVVKLQMVGTCHGCPMSMLTLRLGIERILMEKVEGLTQVISVRPDEIDFDEIEVDDESAP